MDMAVTPRLEARTRSKFDAGTIAVMLAGICAFLDVYTTQALLPHLHRVYHASEVEVSLTVSATILAVAFAAPVVGLLAEAIGRKRVIVPSILGLAVPTFMAATSPSLHALIFWRFVQGLFIPGIIAVMMAYIGEEWPANRVGSVMSTYVSATVLGGFLSRFIAGMVTQHADWRWSFVALALMTLAGGVAVWRWLPPSSNFVPASNARATLEDGIAHLHNPRLLATFGMGFAMLFTLVGTFTYVNFYLAAPPFNLNSGQLGSVFFVYLLGLVVTPLSGRYMDRRGFRRTIVGALALCVVGLTLTLKLSLPVVIAGLALTSSGVFVLQSAAVTQVGKVAGRAKSSAAGLYVTFYYVGGSIGAVLPGWFWMRGGWHATVGILALMAAISVSLGFFASRRPADVLQFRQTL